MEDLLIVSFDKNDRNNEAGLCVARKKPNGDTTVLKMVLDEQARILYRLLTDQSSKAEIMAESEIRNEYGRNENGAHETYT